MNLPFRRALVRPQDVVVCEGRDAVEKSFGLQNIDTKGSRENFASQIYGSKALIGKILTNKCLALGGSGFFE
jgi:hypothetical protein